MAFPDDPLGVTIEAAFGADRTADPATWVWTDLTTRWHLDEDLDVFHGRKEGARQAEPAEISFWLKNTDGQLTPDDARSQWWPHVDEGLPVRITLDPQLPGQETLQFGGFVASIAPVWPSGTGNRALVAVVAGGVLRQHGRGRSLLRDTVHRFAVGIGTGGQAATAYWPLDDPEGSQQALSATGGPPMRTAQLVESGIVPTAPAYPFAWGRGLMHPWLGNGTGLQATSGSDFAGGTLDGQVIGAPAGGFSVDFLRRAAADPGTDEAPLTIFVGVQVGGEQQWSVSFFHDPEQIQLLLIDSDGLTIDSEPAIPAPGINDGNLHHIRLRVDEAAGNGAQWSLWLDAVLLDIGTFDTGLPAVPPPNRVVVDWFAEQAQGRTQPVDIGRVVLWPPFPPLESEMLDAYNGHPGEPAAVRAQRVCAEEADGLTVVGDPVDSHPMGPQYPGTLVDLLRECELADDGILAEETFGFWLRIGRSRYNQDPAIVVDAAQRQLGRQLEPVKDDQRTRNLWIVEDNAGSQAIAVDLADQQRRGTRDDSLTVNVGSPLHLPGRAGWELHRSTVGGLRYPTLTVHLHSSPALVGQVMAARLGDRVQVTNPPRQHPQGEISQLIEGVTHSIRGRRKWTWQAVLAPESPYHIAEVEHPAYGTIGSDRSTLLLDFEYGVDTALFVDILDAALRWVYEGDFEILVGGLPLTVTAVGPFGSVDQEFTVSQPTAGITKTVPAGAPVELLNTSYIGL